MTILLVAIVGYFISGYCWLLYWWILVPFLSVIISGY